MFPPPRLLQRDTAPPVGEPIPVDPAATTLLRSPADVSDDPSAAASALAVLDPSPVAVEVLNLLYAPSLTDEALMDALAASEKLIAAVQGKQQEFLAEVSRRDPDGEEFTTRRGRLRAADRPRHSRSPHCTSPNSSPAGSPTRWSWSRAGFCRSGTPAPWRSRSPTCPDEIAVKVQDRVLPRGCRQTAGQFRAAVRPRRRQVRPQGRSRPARGGVRRPARHLLRRTRLHGRCVSCIWLPTGRRP